MFKRHLELILYFFRLGATSFGGPSVYIAMMEVELVGRRKWLSKQEFFDYLATTYLIPGPNAVEMAGALGFHRAGRLGAITAIVAFVLPAFALSALAAWFYVRYGSMPGSGPFLDGIKPVVVALILAATIQLGGSAIRRWQTAAIALAVALASVAGYDEVLVLLCGAIGGAILLRLTQGPPPTTAGATAAALLLPMASASVATAGGAAMTSAATSVSLWKLGLFFLKVGAVLYGGGYVLVAYLQDGLVHKYHWITQQQLLDAVAIGQITPGPFISTAVFIGYLLGGVAGAAVAAAGILTPSCVLVPVVMPWTTRLRQSRWAALLLDSVMAASIGLMAAVVLTLGHSTLIGWQCWLIATAAFAASLRWKIAPVWLILLGAAASKVLSA